MHLSGGAWGAVVGSHHQQHRLQVTCVPGSGLTHRDGCCDALLVAPQALALLPAHGLQHLVADVVTREAIFRGLLIVPVKEGRWDAECPGTTGMLQGQIKGWSKNVLQKAGQVSLTKLLILA